MKAFPVIAVAMVLLALFYSFSHAMVGFDKNENMYVTAGILIAQGKSIYRDFAYLQMPYLPELYGAVFRASGTAHHIFVARTITWAFWAIGGALVGVIATQLSGDRRFALGSALLYAFSPTMGRINIESSNYVLPATLSLVEIALILSAMQKQGLIARITLSLLAGAAAGLSIGTKLYFLPVVAPFFVLPLVWEKGEKTSAVLFHFVPMVLGLALALTPAAMLFMRDRWLFLFDNFYFHRLATSQILRDFPNAVTPPIRLGDKIEKLRHVLVELSIAVPIMLTAVALCLAGRKLPVASCQLPLKTGDRGISPAGNLQLATGNFLPATLGLTAIIALCVALAMTPMYDQYLALPVPFLLVLAASAYSMVSREGRAALVGILWASVILIAALGTDVRILTSISDARQLWSPYKIEAVSALIRRRLESAHVAGKVATLWPLFATEADLDIYPQFASGPFMLYVGDMMNPADRQHAVGIGTETIEQLFDSDPPAAILVNVDSTSYEKALEKYAITHHYRQVPLTASPTPTLYLRAATNPDSAGTDDF